MKTPEVVVKLLIIALGIGAMAAVMQGEYRWWAWLLVVLFSIIWSTWVWMKIWKSKEKPKDEDKMVNK